MARICTALDAGQPCTRRALPGQPFCYGHHPASFAPRRCLYFNRHGSQCLGIALLGHDHCFTHSPRNPRARSPRIPLQPRTRRQRAMVKWLLFNRMPHTWDPLPEPPQMQ